MLNYEKIGLFLSKKRKTLKLTQKELASQLNITFQAVSRWEKGLSVPSVDLLRDIATIFDMSVDEILNGEEKKSTFSYEKSGVSVFNMDIINEYEENFIETNHYNPAFRGGVYDINQYKVLERPLIISRVLEPGTKQKIAIEYGYIDEMIKDTQYTLINDILSIGGNPLFITNTIISAREDIAFVKKIMLQTYQEAKKFDIKILRGQRSLKPKIMKSSYMINTEMIGIVDYKHLIKCENIKENDCILYIKSNGLHHHGFTLIDSLIEKIPNIKKEKIEEICFMDEIMKPPFCYYESLKDLIAINYIKCSVNITGCGIGRNVERVIPNGLSAFIDLSAIEVPKIYACLKSYLGVEDNEMLNTFNCGVGYILIVSEEKKYRVLQHINSYFTCKQIGCIVKGNKKVHYTNFLKW